jgi:hypothetical protein
LRQTTAGSRSTRTPFLPGEGHGCSPLRAGNRGAPDLQAAARAAGDEARPGSVAAAQPTGKLPASPWRAQATNCDGLTVVPLSVAPHVVGQASSSCALSFECKRCCLAPTRPRLASGGLAVRDEAAFVAVPCAPQGADSVGVLQGFSLRRLTFELSRPARQDALARQRKMSLRPRCRAKAACLAGSALERGVRQHCWACA